MKNKGQKAITHKPGNLIYKPWPLHSRSLPVYLHQFLTGDT